jgi:ubiquinone/menaquinone biosynthesis C-methylase UbiE
MADPPSHGKLVSMNLRRDDEITDVIREHWNWRAATFDRELSQGLHSDEQRNAWLRFLGELAGPPPQRVLDVGCGTGFLALLLAQLGHNVTGIDLSPQMLELARRKAARANAQIEFRLENAAALTDADATYDLIVERHVIWTLPDPAAGIREWLRVLRPGGRLAAMEEKFANNEALAKAYSHPVKAAASAIAEAGLAFICRCAQRGYWRLYSRKYRRIDAQLPFSGGPQADELADFLRRQGLRDVTIEPLMNPELWGEEPPDSRYLAQGTR